MTIRVPEKNILDRFLALFGKSRQIKAPGSDEIYRDLGPYVQIKGKREGFWKALFGKKGDYL